MPDFLKRLKHLVNRVRHVSPGPDWIFPLFLSTLLGFRGRSWLTFFSVFELLKQRFHLARYFLLCRLRKPLHIGKRMLEPVNHPLQSVNHCFTPSCIYAKPEKSQHFFYDRLLPHDLGWLFTT